MALAVLAAPATTLLSTLTRVKAELEITDTSSDDVLGDILTRASSAITRECGRTGFGVATYQETLAGTGSRLLGLLNVPVLAVTEVLQDTEVLAPTSSEPQDGYSIEDAEAGVLYRAVGWSQSQALLLWGSEAYASRYILPGASGPVRYAVTYTAGYLLPAQGDYLPYDPTAGTNPTGRADPPPLPGAIEQACLHTVRAWWLARSRDPSITHVKTEELSVTYGQPAQEAERALPTVALGLLRDYRRVA